MKKIIFVLLSFVLIVGCNQKKKDEIKIGVILPLTGNAASYGESMKNGLELALSELNQMDFKNDPIELIFEDSEAKPANAVFAINKLITANNVDAIIGPLTSGEVLSVAPIAEKEKTVLITPTASSPAITKAGDYIFRNLTSDVFDGIAIARYAFTKLNYKKIAIAYLNNEFGNGLRDAFKLEANNLGMIITKEEAFLQDAIDFKTQIELIKKSKSDALFIVGGKEMGRFLKQASELKMDLPILSVGVFEDPDILRIAGKTIENAYYTFRTFDPNSENEEVKKFVTSYQSKYLKEPDLYASLSYDALKMIAFALIKKDVNSSNLKEELYKIKNFPGVTGMTTVDKNGDVNKPMGIKSVRNGKFVWIEKP